MKTPRKDKAEGEMVKPTEGHPVQINQYGPDAEKIIRETKGAQPGKQEKAYPGGVDPREVPQAFYEVPPLDATGRHIQTAIERKRKGER